MPVKLCSSVAQFVRFNLYDCRAVSGIDKQRDSVLRYATLALPLSATVGGDEAIAYSLLDPGTGSPMATNVVLVLVLVGVLVAIRFSKY